MRAAETLDPTPVIEIGDPGGIETTSLFTIVHPYANSGGDS